MPETRDPIEFVQDVPTVIEPYFANVRLTTGEFKLICCQGTVVLPTTAELLEGLALGYSDSAADGKPLTVRRHLLANWIALSCRRAADSQE